ncbi:metal ABC transporter solute-binding protein, Zn/Mn family [Salinicoccus albus]|uniref:metal ABC transporter solute-binding protein, Zn/Mn family n=1 Tax=Salinicoccus albus TaxID=418756 RepID=UPI00038267F0|nr:zinc ABC transporter substrate-binding protein [Salinicoccus albus]
MKKLIFLAWSVLLLTAGCSGGGNAETSENDNNVAVSTTFLHDMVRVIDDGVDAFDTELIIPAGEDPHVYQPTSSDLETISESDILLYQGLNFEGRMADALSDGTAVGENFEDEQLETEEGGETDPHFWFNIDMYKTAMTIVKNELSNAAPEHEEAFQTNLDDYFEALDELDQYVTDRIEEIPEESRILITPHDAFGYLSEANDLEVHAPQGISTESEVSNSVINETADIIIENNISAIFVETTTNPDQMRRLEEIVNSRGQEVEVVSGEDEALYSDSLGEAGEAGETYIGMYEHNIDTIVNHLAED